jgi:hypothetical protein
MTVEIERPEKNYDPDACVDTAWIDSLADIRRNRAAI